MNIESLRTYCLNMPDVLEDFPFGPETIVFKVKGKIFCLVGLEGNPLSFNVKCDPELALELREKYLAVLPGYHMNKKHWNTIIIDGSIKEILLKQFLDSSYNLVAGRKH